MSSDEFFLPQDLELRAIADAMFDVEWGRISPSVGEVRAQAILGDKGLDDEPDPSDPYWADLAREHLTRLRDFVAYVRDESRYSDEQKEALVALLQAEIAVTLTRGANLIAHGAALASARLGVTGGRVSLAQARAIALLARAAVEVARATAQERRW